MMSTLTGISYYFVRNATTNYGPLHFAVAVQAGATIKQAVNAEGHRRGIVISHDWNAEPIDEAEVFRLTR